MCLVSIIRCLRSEFTVLVRIFVFLLLLKPGKVFRIVYTPEPSPWPTEFTSTGAFWDVLLTDRREQVNLAPSHKTQLSPWRVAQVLNSAVPGLRRYLNGPCNTTHHTACCWCCCFTFLAAKIWSYRTCPPILSSCPAAWVLSLPSSWPLPASEEHLRSDSRLQFFSCFSRANMSKLLWKYWEWRWMTTWPMTTVRGQGTGLLSKEARRRQRHSSTSCAFWAQRVTKSEVWSRTLWIRRFRIDSSWFLRTSVPLLGPAADPKRVKQLSHFSLATSGNHSQNCGILWCGVVSSHISD